MELSSTPETKKTSQRTLLILDLDGTIIHTTPARPLDAKDGDDDAVEIKLADETEPFYVRLRPGLQKFLANCRAASERIQLAVWSAAGQSYVDAIVRSTVLFPLEDELLFVFSGRRAVRKHSSLHNDVLTIKPLTKVWRRYREFGRHNTLILDDTPATYVRNYGNAVPIPSWSGAQTDCELERAWNVIDRLSKSSDVRCARRWCGGLLIASDA